MRILPTLFARLRSLARQSRHDQDLDDDNDGVADAADRDDDNDGIDDEFDSQSTREEQQSVDASAGRRIDHMQGE